ncbi:MAG: sulfate ABC transporter substrate-binding protein [Oligoflexia bacterium]|nr:sulfate ABC transporter substrate-binding protein [Oligoflexia bacterium]MBF0365842.1 sulfate ABC transporter substrate-binding protein [Oligoflexia bacterium]
MLFKLLFLSCFLCIPSICFSKTLDLLNVSYDPTREFYKEFNREFEKYWSSSNSAVKIRQSHSGSATQARAVISGLQADVVTLALAYDIDIIAKESQLLPSNWQQRLPNNSSPYTSTIIFLVRKGNPKNIHDWSDLIKSNVEVIMPNPKTSGAARWNYLAAWGYALQSKLAEKKSNAAAEKYAKEFVTALIKNIPVLDTGARGSTTTFVNRNIGDVLITWENEALLAFQQMSKSSSASSAHSQFEIVIPSLSILARPPVAVIDKIVDKRKSREMAEAYLKYLYTPVGQRLAAKHFFRPALPELVDKKELAIFPTLKLFTLEDFFGSWEKAHKIHFADGGTFDQIYRPHAP